MKAITFLQPGAPDVLTPTEIPTPKPEKNHVLVKLAYAGLNHVDIWIRKGNPAYPVTYPHVLGCDGAGVIEAVEPEAEGVSVGDRVLIVPGISCGECAFCKQ